MISVRNLSLTFATQTIFDSVSFSLQKDDRIGLFGLNGAGKSTLLKIIAGYQQADSGTITIAKGCKIAYLPQEVTLSSTCSILEETMSIFSQMVSLQTRAAQLEQMIENNVAQEEAVSEYAQICQDLSELEPEKKRAQVIEMLQGLGFSALQLQDSVGTLSVGWKMRIVLAKLLLQNADFYLFDEPTNHLDIVAKEWFLQFLSESSFGFMLVCHDKQFLNKVCDRILEVERGVITFYTGSYNDYVTQKEATLERLKAAHIQQQKEIERLESTARRFAASATKAAMAQSMFKKIEKIERIVLPPTFNKISFHFPPLERCARVVIEAENIGYTFGQKKIFAHAKVHVERGQKIAIVAANGVGKSTLLNIISGKLPLQTGNIEIGTNVKIALFDQDQTKSLNMNASVIDNARAAGGGANEQKIRTLLGSFLFDNNAINKKASVLSGGERNRLGMVRILLGDANCFFLDEPTNHLDIPSKDILLAALQAYQGTILFVSHDQDFVNRLCTHILELTPTGTTLYEGDYEQYLYQKQKVNLQNNVAATIASAPNKAPVAIQKESISKDGRKQLRALEQKIARLEQKIDEISLSFADLDYGTSQFEVAQKQLAELKKELQSCTKQWEELIA